VKVNASRQFYVKKEEFGFGIGMNEGKNWDENADGLGEGRIGKNWHIFTHSFSQLHAFVQ
jgi:hypothetical protein